MAITFPMVADMEGCGRIYPCLPAGRYDTLCRGVLRYARKENSMTALKQKCNLLFVD